MEDEFIKKLKEKYEKGEISKETYEDILKRYLEEKNEKMEEEQEKMENEDRDVADFVENIIENAMKSVEMAMKEVNMEMKKEFSTKEGKNYKCAGSCVLGPGRYDYISASGSLMITGDVIAERISVSGALRSEGSIKVKTSLRCAGAAKINGDVIAESISAAGVFRAKKVFGETVKLSGAIDVEKIKGESVQIGGYVSADHISGEEIRIKLSKKKSMVEEIHGEEIEVECERGFFRKCSGRLEAKRIEGEEIRLENVVADVVKGESVIVGDGCVIGRLEAEDMKISKNSKVKEVIRK